MAQPKRFTKEQAKQDSVYRSVVKAFDELLADAGFVSKEEVLKKAEALAWRTHLRWGYVVDFVTEDYAGVVLLALTWRYFASPRNKKAHSVDPGKYVAPNYTVAEGFASVAQFVQQGERERLIAQSKYSQQKIAAARMLEKAEGFGTVIANNPMPALRAI